MLFLHNNTKSSVEGAVAPMAPPFSLSPPGPFMIPAHKGAKFKIAFAPMKTGEQTADASFALGVSGEPNLMVPVEGNGAPPRLQLSRTTINFGTLRRPSQSPANRFLRIGNSGRGTLTVNVSQMTPPFSVNPSGSATYKQGQGRTYIVSFSPIAAGPASQALNISSNDPNRPSATVSVSGNSAFTPSPTPSPTLTVSLTTPTGTPTSRATPSATITIPALSAARSTPSNSAGAVLFAEHPLGGAMLGAPVGHNAENLGTFAQVYVPEKDMFRNAGRMRSQRVGATGTVLPNHKVLIAGGGACSQDRSGTRTCIATDTADLYDPAAHKFVAAGSGSNGKMTTARMGHSAVVISGCGCALDGDVLLAGGNPGTESAGNAGAVSSAAPLPSAELYDYRTDSFVALSAAMGSAREGAVAAAIPGAHGKILIAGGDNKGFFQNSIASAEIFDPASESFSPTGAMNTAREFAGAVVLDPAVVSGSEAGDILAAGGIAATGNLTGTSLDSAELYDPVSGTWSTVGAPMAAARALHSMTLFTSGPDGGQVLIAGGVAFDAHGKLSTTKRTSHGDAELFDPASGTFSKTGSMNGARGGHGAALLGSGPRAGDVLVAGGQKCAGTGCGAAHPATELYDPASASFGASKAKMNPPIGAVLGGVVPVP